MPDPTEPHEPLAEVGRYALIADARVRALVAAARDVAHLIEREGDEWVLFVEERRREEILEELAAFEAEERARPPAPKFLPAERIDTLSLYVAGWLMSASFLAQQLAGPRWMERGAATSDAILHRGEWWRTLTALTLHGDVSHIAANIATGLLFAAFVIPHLGVGLTWLAIVVTGALGNAANAWGYRGEAHASIGASTGVFGALGILVGAELFSRLASPHTRSRWQLVLPIGAGLALLAYLGVGDEHKNNVDIMAHLWGFVVGLPLGLLAVWLRVKERVPRWAQRLAAVSAVALLALAWALALR